MDIQKSDDIAWQNRLALNIRNRPSNRCGGPNANVTGNQGIGNACQSPMPQVYIRAADLGRQRFQ
jgi:hypothetical protein